MKLLICQMCLSIETQKPFFLPALSRTSPILSAVLSAPLFTLSAVFCSKDRSVPTAYKKNNKF